MAFFNNLLEEIHPDAPELQLIFIESKPEMAVPRTADRPSPNPQKWAKGPGTSYGAPISFRGLQHAPTNEQGVVYLFGWLAASSVLSSRQSNKRAPTAKRSVASTTSGIVGSESELSSSSLVAISAIIIIPYPIAT
jgi:hypothetical protein